MCPVNANTIINYERTFFKNLDGLFVTAIVGGFL